MLDTGASVLHAAAEDGTLVAKENQVHGSNEVVGQTAEQNWT